MPDFSHYFVGKQGFKIYQMVFDEITIWDCHAHIGKDRDGSKISQQELLRYMRTYDVKKAIVFPLNEERKQQCFELSNNDVFSLYKKQPTKIIPFFRLDPKVRWRNEFERCVSLGFRGIKLHPNAQHFDIIDESVMDIYIEAEHHNLAVMLHTGFRLLDIARNLEKLSRKFRKLKFILGHAAFVDIEEAIRRLKHRKNIIFDTSTLKIFDIYDLLENLPPERVAYGSDTPYLDMPYAMESLLHTALFLDIKIQDIEKIFSGNLMKWFGE